MDGFDQCHRHIGRADGKSTKVGKIGIGPGWCRHDRFEDCRHHDRKRYRLKGGTGSCGFEFFVKDHRGTDGEGRGGEDVEAAHMEHRQDVQDDIILGHPMGIDAHLGIASDGRLGQHDAFGFSGRA